MDMASWGREVYDPSFAFVGTTRFAGMGRTSFLYRFSGSIFALKRKVTAHGLSIRAPVL